MWSQEELATRRPSGEKRQNSFRLIYPVTKKTVQKIHMYRLTGNLEDIGLKDKSVNTNVSHWGRGLLEKSQHLGWRRMGCSSAKEGSGEYVPLARISRD